MILLKLTIDKSDGKLSVFIENGLLQLCGIGCEILKFSSCMSASIRTNNFVTQAINFVLSSIYSGDDNHVIGVVYNTCKFVTMCHKIGTKRSWISPILLSFLV